MNEQEEQYMKEVYDNILEVFIENEELRGIIEDLENLDGMIQEDKSLEPLRTNIIAKLGGL